MKAVMEFTEQQMKAIAEAYRGLREDEEEVWKIEQKDGGVWVWCGRMGTRVAGEEE